MIKSFLVPVIMLMLFSCKHTDSETAQKATDTQTESRTPVTVTSISYTPLQEFIELNATSVYLQKSYVKSNLTGYIKTVNIKYASSVKAGQVLFTLKTKESDAIGNTINNLNQGFRFSGINSVRAAAGGYVSELNHQAGDYVQDGEQLAVISNVNSFVFIMEVPYEYRQYVVNNKQVELTLPDGERVSGTIQTSLPFMDSVSQTQAVAIKVNPAQQIPQNLVAKVRIIKISRPAASSLPIAAVLSDETHSEFWVMKLINDSTAVKIPVKKGIETDERIEIISPSFYPKERIIVTGNYGLSDTASVKIEVPGAEK
jgi:multidrug efflux pump subunit AcrA (membrane-fusion protein)